MNGFWRRTSKTFFYIALIITLLEFFSYLPSFLKMDAHIGSLFLFGGIVIILIIFSVWGIFLELCYDVAQIKEKCGKSASIIAAKPQYSHKCECGCSVEEGASYCVRCGKKQE